MMKLRKSQPCGYPGRVSKDLESLTECKLLVIRIDPRFQSITHSGVHVVKHVDEDEFLKVYTRNVKAIFDLKPTTQRILQYLMTELQKTPNADAVYLAWVGAEQYFTEHHINVSRTPFQRSLKELLKKGFVTESTKPNMFWFNPHLFFNGNRMTFVHEYRMKKTITDEES
ncbi:hypothetical protein [Piscirickettsia litoralis]|uniref:Plasmid replication protein RepL domain-containing protein n=1 Tax=Piscirickettsia litoralis TaxID=1891921 RepID=A0ABX3A5E6_9GAMM|nr:hypothetical protein [Piscirickettsia litoralis]ODN41324.1 hypothetical protein BGC07_17350 [Piscirickettsia litoralis]